MTPERSASPSSTIDEKLSAERAKRPGFQGPELQHHRRVQPERRDAALPRDPRIARGDRGDGLLLIDSGGQYLGGTTDITRVWPIGTINAEHRRDYTLVLKGTIALSRARFPRGTLSPMRTRSRSGRCGSRAWTTATAPAHGVGYFLNVHEGPQSISKVIPDAHMAMEPA